jgi:hypothetical protein
MAKKMLLSGEAFNLSNFKLIDHQLTIYEFFRQKRLIFFFL